MGREVQVSSDVLKHFITVLITGFFTLSGSYIAFKGTSQSADAAILSTLYDRIGSLEMRVSTLTAQVSERDIKLAKKYEGSEVLKNYLNSMPYPAWIKTEHIENNDQIFRNWHINPEYEKTFNVSLDRIKGRTDYGVWPKETAKIFYDNDVLVLKRVNSRCFMESFAKSALDPVSKSNPLISGYVCKWPAIVDGKRAVAGQILYGDMKE